MHKQKDSGQLNEAEAREFAELLTEQLATPRFLRRRQNMHSPEMQQKMKRFAELAQKADPQMLARPVHTTKTFSLSKSAVGIVWFAVLVYWVSLAWPINGYKQNC